MHEGYSEKVSRGLRRGYGNKISCNWVAPQSYARDGCCCALALRFIRRVFTQPGPICGGLDRWRGACDRCAGLRVTRRRSAAVKQLAPANHVACSHRCTQRLRSDDRRLALVRPRAGGAPIRHSLKRKFGAARGTSPTRDKDPPEMSERTHGGAHPGAAASGRRPDPAFAKKEIRRGARHQPNKG